MKNIRSILLLGTENVLALSVIRSLGAEFPDAQIHTYSPKESGGGKAKSVSERSKYISSCRYFQSWKDPFFHFKLKNVIAETKADVILPVSDAGVKKISAIKDSIKDEIHLPPVPELKIYKVLNNKFRLSELLSQLHLPQPKTWYLKPNIVPVLKPEDFPLLVKPKKGSSGIGIQKINSEKELLDFQQRTDVDKHILQEIIPGYEIGCSVLAENGTIKSYTMQKVLGNKGFGVATALKFIRNEQVLRQTKYLIEKCKYNGLAHLDFRMDSRDNTPKLLDFNARFWHSLRASKAAGVDFTYLYCLAAFGIYPEKTSYEPITYFLGSNTIRYYFKKLFNLRKPYEATKSVYTDLWDRLGDPWPEFARYIK